jgi:hypothetical protein
VRWVPAVFTNHRGPALDTIKGIEARITTSEAAVRTAERALVEGRALDDATRARDRWAQKFEDDPAPPEQVFRYTSAITEASAVVGLAELGLQHAVAARNAHAVLAAVVLRHRTAVKAFDAAADHAADLDAEVVMLVGKFIADLEHAVTKLAPAITAAHEKLIAVPPDARTACSLDLTFANVNPRDRSALLARVVQLLETRA